MQRPAESAGAGGAIALLIAHMFGVSDPDLLAAIGAGLLLVPAAVTLFVSNGGVSGVGRLLWRGRQKDAAPKA